MLSCKEVSQRASALLDGDLGLMERLHMRLHLAMCRGCSAFVGQMRQTRDLTTTAVAQEQPVPDEARLATLLDALKERNLGG